MKIKEKEMKALVAERVKDKWLITVKETFSLSNRDEIIAEIKQRGLKIFKATVREDYIFAD